MSKIDIQVMNEAHDEACTILATEKPDADLADPVNADMAVAYEAGVWFGIWGCLTVLERHGYILPLAQDGESRE